MTPFPLTVLQMRINLTDLSSSIRARNDTLSDGEWILSCIVMS
jgi:hypothetical protein